MTIRNDHQFCERPLETSSHFYLNITRSYALYKLRLEEGPGSWQLAAGRQHKVISVVHWVLPAFNKSKRSLTVSSRSCFSGATLLTFIFKVYGYLFSQTTYRERDSFNSSWGPSRIIKNKRACRTHKKNKPVFVKLSLKDSISYRLLRTLGLW